MYRRHTSLLLCVYHSYLVTIEPVKMRTLERNTTILVDTVDQMQTKLGKD